jgi:single-strand DNA-binding protein
MWGERGEKVAQYLLKGATVAVSGEAGVREHEGKAYATLNVRELTLLGSKQGDELQRGGGGSARPARQAAKPAADEFDDAGDIPFVTNRGAW